jgi:ammonia channel protein AmtB
MALTWIFAQVVDMFYGLSVSDAEEQVGLDISQHGEEAYS